MSQAVMFSIPAYVLDSTSIATVVGYQVQGSSTTGASGIPTNWTDIPNSPFTSNINIVDTSGDASHTKLYRCRPVLQVTQNSTVYTLDVPFSEPFCYDQPLYDWSLTCSMLPILRTTYLGDIGVPQSNGTLLADNTGPGQGLWTPNGTTTRFPLQYVENDDPIRVLENWYKLTWTRGGVAQSAVPGTDYVVDTENGVVEFTTAPLSGDYLRFDFRECTFSNEFLLSGLRSGVAALSQYGINGYSLHQSNNLYFLQKQLANPDLADIVCKIAVRNIREGLTEAALRANASWRDGGASFDPEPSRALEFLVQKLDLSDKMIRQLCNGWIRTNTIPLYRGEYDVMFDMSQMSPVSMAMFEQFSAFTGYAGIGLAPGYALAFWI